MEALLAVLIAILITGFVVILHALKSQKKSGPDNSLLMLQSQLSDLSRALDAKLGQVAQESRHTVSEVSRAMQQQFGHSAKIIGEVTEKLTRVDEAARQTLAMNEQIKKLQDTLTNPKQRGVLGEYYLEAVLKNVLPPGAYQMQYAFKNGEVVDAAVFMDKRVIPVDSKFSLENYNRFAQASDSLERKKYESAFVGDIKMRIDETAKYVRPQESTMEFAFMFIPSEAIYYDLLINRVGAAAEDKNMIHYAAQKKVIVVSPTSFLAYLQTVLQGLRNQKISEQAQEIIKQVANLGRHLSGYEDYLKRLGKNLGTTVSMYNNAYKEFVKIDKDVLKIADKSIGAEILRVDAPAAEEL